MVHESPLERVETAGRREALRRLHMPSAGLPSEGAAGADGPAVQQDRAGAADLDTARQLGGGKPQAIAEHVQQELVCADLVRVGSTVDQGLKGEARLA